MIASAAGLASATDGIRLSLHVFAAAIWVGGQFTLAGLVPAARKAGGDLTKVLARAFNRLAWPAFGVLVATGFWNLSAIPAATQTHAWKVVLYVKLALVVVSGVGAFAHTKSKSKAGLAIWGALGALSSLAVLILGVFLAG